MRAYARVYCVRLSHCELSSVVFQCMMNVVRWLLRLVCFAVGCVYLTFVLHAVAKEMSAVHHVNLCRVQGSLVWAYYILHRVVRRMSAHYVAVHFALMDLVLFTV